MYMRRRQEREKLCKYLYAVTTYLHDLLAVTILSTFHLHSTHTLHITQPKQHTYNSPALACQALMPTSLLTSC